MNDDLFSARVQPEFENILLLCTYELSNYIRYQVEMVRVGSITTVARHAGVSLPLQLFYRVASS